MVTAFALLSGLSLPLSAMERVRAPLNAETPLAGTSFAGFATVSPAQQVHKLDAWSLVLADPLTMPLILAGFLALVTAIIVRRRRRRRIAWAYLPTMALPGRMLAKLR